MNTIGPSRNFFAAAMLFIALQGGECARVSAGYDEPAVLPRPGLTEDLPRELDGVGVVQRLGEQVPLDRKFVNEAGETITLGELFRPGRPVILTLNYYRCPKLCSLTLNGMVNALNDLEWSAGEKFDIVTISFDPTETHELAELKKAAYLTQYRRPTAASGWHFLTGTEADIRAVADAVGFYYHWDERTEQYAHASSIIFITPDGRISQYMNEVAFEPRDVRLALVEASQGKIGSLFDQILLLVCYEYDPNSSGYVLAAWKLMRVGGLLTLTIMVGGLAFLWRRDLRTRRQGDLLSATTPPMHDSSC